MTPDEIDKILAQAAERALPRGPEPEAIGRVEAAILKDLRPAAPLAPSWAITLGLVALFVAAAGAGAAALGMYGFRALNEMQRALIFPALTASAWLAAVACARAMTPAGGARRDWAAFSLAVAGFPLLFALVFQDYGVRNLVKEGIPCLVAGMSVAIPAGLAIGWILRRGFVLDSKTAGLAAGTLAGLAGMGMLELHCANLKAIHVILWHVAVVLVSGILGLAQAVYGDHRQ